MEGTRSSLSSYASQITKAEGEEHKTAASILQPSETADKLLRRLHLRPLKTGIKILDLEIQQGLRSGAVIELSGRSATGKTEILLQIIASCILPSKWEEVELGGEDSTIIYYDLNSQLDILRVVAILEARIRRHRNGRKFDVEGAIKSSLERLHVIRCGDSVEFAISLSTLDILLQDIKEGKIVLMVDSISSFFFLDKDNVGRQRQRRIFQQLSNLIGEYNLILFATKQLFFR